MIQLSQQQRTDAGNEEFRDTSTNADFNVNKPKESTDCWFEHTVLSMETMIPFKLKNQTAKWHKNCYIIKRKWLCRQ